jgi:hypothetical protein
MSSPIRDLGVSKPKSAETLINSVHDKQAAAQISTKAAGRSFELVATGSLEWTTLDDFGGRSDALGG